jgi:PKHD-type hydroxylase
MWRTFNYYEIFRAQFSAEECRRIIALREYEDREAGQLTSHDGRMVRDSRLWWIYRDPSTAWIFRRIRGLVQRYNRGWKFEIEPLAHAAQLTRYGVGQRYDWHMDAGEGATSLRKISIVVELSAPASRRGGGLEVFHGEGRRRNRVPLQRGDVACFPSFVVHRARPVQRGTRWSLVFWIKGRAPLR